MAKGMLYPAERALWRDPRSRLKVLRLTHGPTISMNMYFEMCSFTQDDQYVMFLSQRHAGRDAPWDVFRAKTDGLELVQLTETDYLSGVVFCPHTGQLLYQASNELRTMDVVTLKEETVAETPVEPGAHSTLLASIDASGETYFASAMTQKGVARLFRVDLKTRKVHGLLESKMQCHIHVDPTGKTLAFGNHTDEGLSACLMDPDGRNLRPLPFKRFAHHTWFGSTGKFQGTLLPPDRALVALAEEDTTPKVLTGGRYYWHSGASADAQWIVSDTNWPQEGLYLLHVPTGNVTYICDPRSSCSHPQWTHPHPSLSPGMKYVLFNSDMTGIGQVHLAELTEEFVAKAAQGYPVEAQPLV